MTCKNSSGRREWSSVLKSHTSALHPPPRFPHTCSLWPVVEGCKGTFGLCEVRGGGWGLLWTSSCAWSGRSQFGEMGEGGEVFRAGPCRGIASPCVDATHLRELKKKKKSPVLSSIIYFELHFSPCSCESSTHGRQTSEIPPTPTPVSFSMAFFFHVPRN